MFTGKAFLNANSKEISYFHLTGQSIKSKGEMNSNLTKAVCPKVYKTGNSIMIQLEYRCHQLTALGLVGRS